jgi:hypothetical protein
MYKIGALLAGLVYLFSGCAGLSQDQQKLSASLLPQEKRSADFEQTLKHLDLGGPVFAYLDIDDEVKQLTAILQEIYNNASEKSGETGKRLDMSALVASLGLEEIQAVGFSSYPEGKIFRNKTFVLIKGERRGILKLMGGPAHAFEITTKAPADADLVLEHDLSLKSAWDLVLEILSRIDGAKADKLKALALQKIPELEIGYQEIIDKLDTRLSLVLRIDAKTQIKIPGVPLAIPKLQVYLEVDNLGFLVSALSARLKGMPMIEMKQDEQFEWIGSAVSTPAEMGSYRPMLALEKKTGRLLMATSKTFLDEINGQKKPLSESTDFIEATETLPKEGNAIGYLSSRFSQEVAKVMDSASQHFPEIKEAEFFYQMVLPDPGVSVCSITSNFPDGIMFRSNLTSSHKAQLLFSASSSIIGIIAAVAVPAFIEYIERAKAAEAKHTQALEQARREMDQGPDDAKAKP